MTDIENIIKYSQTLKILYVEDNQEARESTEIILEEFFKSIIVAVNGQDGLDKFKQNQENIDLIITDINMPKLNGLEMTKEIRKINNNIPILVLSAYNESGFFMESIKLGVEGYLLKPIDIDQFLGVLEKITIKLQLASEVEKSKSLLDQYKQITDKSSIISILNTEGVITYVNNKFCELSQYSKDELIGTNYHSILNYKQPKEINDAIWNTISVNKDIWQGTVKFVSRDGSPYYLKTTIKPILDKDNNIIEYIALRDDVTDIMNPKKQLDDIIQNSEEPLIVYIKLDEFETLEEVYDNITVEEIQDKITIYLESHMPETCKFDKVYQLGNGEYAMVNEKSVCMNNENEFIEHLKLFQNKVKIDTVDIDDIDYDMSIIISLSYDKEKVLESAKLGIKKLLNTKQDFIISNNFAQIEQDKAQKNIKTISMVKQALNDFKIVSYFQPIINNKTQEIEKYE